MSPGGASPSAKATANPGTTPAPTKKPTPNPTPGKTPTPTPKPVTSIKLTVAYSGFSAPIFVTGAHDGTNRLFVVQESGPIKVIVGGKTLATPFLNISGPIKYGGEEGLLGLAFSPSFRTNGSFYVYYNESGSGNIVVVQVRRG